MGRKLEEGLCPLFGEGSWVPIQHNVAWAEAYLHTKWHLDKSSQLLDKVDCHDVLMLSLIHI